MASTMVGLMYRHQLTNVAYAAAICNGVASIPAPYVLVKNHATDTVL